MAGKLYCGDCLEVLEKKIEPESIDLIYLDPPFFSNRNYEVIWGDEAEVRSFDDRWEGGIEVYAAWMADRLRSCHRVLKSTGSLYLHCDWHASHYLRIALDGIFGRNNFINEIIWHYRKWSAGKGLYQRNHDNILFYSKSNSKERAFNPIYMPRAKSTLKRFGDQKIISGYDGVGKRAPAQMSKEKSAGVALDDVWEISRVPPIKQLYPTEKPIALLERIVSVSTNPGQIVLDPFCGCGTSVVAAEKLKLDWIGIDISPTSIKVIKDRLLKLKYNAPEIIGLPTTIKELRALKPFEFQNWVIRERFNGAIGPKGGDKGIDGYSFMLHEPIQVKQSDGVGRNVIDNFHAAIRRTNKKRGYIVAFSFGKGAYEEAASIKKREEIEVILLTAEELLSKGAV
jgi:DNA modification methylase